MRFLGNKKQILIHLGFLCLLLFKTSSLTATPPPPSSTHVGTTSPSCREGTITSEIEASDHSNQVLDQGESETCYGHAAYRIIDYLYHSENRSLPNLCLPGLISEGTGRRYQNEGHALSVLYNLKNSKVPTDRGFHVDHLSKLSLLDTANRRSPAECLKPVNEVLATLKNIRPNFDLVTEIQGAFSKADKLGGGPSYHFLNSLKESKTTDIPPYNLSLLSQSEVLKESANNSQQVSYLKKKIRELLKPEGHYGPDAVYPIVIGYCSNFPTKNQKIKDYECEAHEAVISGARKICRNGNWEDQLKLLNSLGRNQDGWKDANQLSQAFLALPGAELIRALPCNPSRSQESKLPQCVESIEGRFSLHTIIDHNMTQAIASTVKTHIKEINLKNAQGDTPLHIAVHNGNSGAILALIHAGANVNSQDNTGTTPLFYAVALKQKDATEALIRAGANIHVKNPKGYLPIEVAIGQFILDQNIHSFDLATLFINLYQNQHISEGERNHIIEAIDDLSEGQIDAKLSLLLFQIKNIPTTGH